MFDSFNLVLLTVWLTWEVLYPLICNKTSLQSFNNYVSIPSTLSKTSLIGTVLNLKNGDVKSKRTRKVYVGKAVFSSSYLTETNHRFPETFEQDLTSRARGSVLVSTRSLRNPDTRAAWLERVLTLRGGEVRAGFRRPENERTTTYESCARSDGSASTSGKADKWLSLQPAASGGGYVKQVSSPLIGVGAFLESHLNVSVS